MKQYTKKQIHDAMKRFLDVDFEQRTTVDGRDSLVYATSNENFKIFVDLSTGMFSGFEVETRRITPPHGSIQSIKGM
ncbi:hypothetical protein [Sulfurimonas indica]|uniref:hypothetical protein n=1 Tax=Sulfurimonas TaxID=202746 RepID=UPI0012642E88|nr:hypothetical protein [Sulfurimonas indica]